MQHSPLSCLGASPELPTVYVPIALTLSSISVFELWFRCLCLAGLATRAWAPALKPVRDARSPFFHGSPLSLHLQIPAKAQRASLCSFSCLCPKHYSCSAMQQLVQRFISCRTVVFCFMLFFTNDFQHPAYLFDCLCEGSGSLERTSCGDSRTLTAGFHHQDYFSYLCLLILTADVSYHLKHPVSFIFSVFNNFVSANSLMLLFTMHNTGACTALWSSTGNNLETADTVFRVVMSRWASQNFRMHNLSTA